MAGRNIDAHSWKALKIAPTDLSCHLLNLMSSLLTGFESVLGDNFSAECWVGSSVAEALRWPAAAWKDLIILAAVV